MLLQLRCNLDMIWGEKYWSDTFLQEAEAKINCGQIEEVIIQAENELSLSRSMLEWKAWEPLCEAAPENQWKWPI